MAQTTLESWKNPLIQTEKVERINDSNRTVGGYAVSLAKFGVTGFSKEHEYIATKNALDKQEIIYECNNKKMMIWLPVIGESLRKIFARNN